MFGVVEPVTSGRSLAGGYFEGTQPVGLAATGVCGRGLAAGSGGGTNVMKRIFDTMDRTTPLRPPFQMAYKHLHTQTRKPS